jgi:hypothetical protein
MRSDQATRARIDVDLTPDEALALIEASFQRAKTSPTRWLDHGWTIDRRADDRIVITTKHPGDYLLEPLPEDFVSHFPETLGLQVIVKALAEGGSRVRVRLIRCRVRATAGAVVGDVLGIFAFGLPLVHTVMHCAEMISLRENRRAATRRLLGLAIAPLVEHERHRAGGPFRGQP